MFELTNEQRKCFALIPVSDKWERIEIQARPDDNFKIYLYLDNDIIVKCILVGDSQYCEYELYEKVSTDRKYLLPKTSKGKPVIMSAASIQRRNGVGMRLNYIDKNIHLYNEKTECSYYFNSDLNDNICDLIGFEQWVNQWCNDTTDDDIADIVRFSQQKRKHIRYKEGDVFRFKIGRRIYGYGRILLDYDRMRKMNEPFWDILMSKPVVCSVYHIVTERDDLSIDELQELASLPSTIIADNCLYYGEYEIIGNLPITEHEDYPIMYGNSLDARERAVCYQCGKVFRKIENSSALFGGFTNNGVSFNLNVNVDILLQCIKKKSNEPYWTDLNNRRRQDLRDPKYADKLQLIKNQFNI